MASLCGALDHIGRMQRRPSATQRNCRQLKPLCWQKCHRSSRQPSRQGWCNGLRGISTLPRYGTTAQMSGQLVTHARNSLSVAATASSRHAFPAGWNRLRARCARKSFGAISANSSAAHSRALMLLRRTWLWNAQRSECTSNVSLVANLIHSDFTEVNRCRLVIVNAPKSFRRN